MNLSEPLWHAKYAGELDRLLRDLRTAADPQILNQQIDDLWERFTRESVSRKAELR